MVSLQVVVKFLKENCYWLKFFHFTRTYYSVLFLLKNQQTQQNEKEKGEKKTPYILTFNKNLNLS